MDKRNCLMYAFQIAVGITMLALLLVGGAGASTLTVNASGGADYLRIQDAIDNATAGGTIEVHSGIYYENVNVNKQLILRSVDTGGGKPVIDAGGSGNAITLSAGGSTLEGFNVTNATNGIYIISSDNIVKSNNATTNTNSGIEIFCDGLDELTYFNQCNSNILIDNIVSKNSIGFYLSSYHYAKFGPDGSSYNNILVGNKASYNSDWGIFIENMRSGMVHSSETYLAEAHNNISYNIVSNNGNGIYLHSGNNILIGNNASNNTNIGLSLDSTENIIDDDGSGSYIGDSPGVGDNTLSYNTISNNGNGIYVKYSWDNTLIVNSILNNNNGIILNNSKNNLIYNNYFSNVNNAINSGTNIWNTTKTSGTNIVGGYYLGGNVWEYPNGTGFSQTCTDVDIDGICDLTHMLDSINTDYLPLAYNIMPPAGVTNLTNDSYAMNYINWTWTDPSEPDFEHVEVYLNSDFKINVSSGVKSYNATNLTPGTQYTIGTKTVDTAGNVNDTMVTAVAITAADTTAPVITLLGTSPVTVQVGSVYTDAGATALDNYDGNITLSIVTVNPVNTAVKGTYTVTYNVNDSSNNPAVQVTRTVNVVDTTAPVITLAGISPVTIEVGSVYTDAGATASDNYDGNLTTSIVTVNPVNTSVKGTYTVTYNVNDSSNNPAVQVTRTVNVVDTTAPVWNPVPSDQRVQVGSGFSYDINADDQTQVNYSINDTVNFAIDQVTGLITNITALNVGTYGLNITATDTSSNSVSQIITVTVQAEPTYSVSGYVFDNKNAKLVGVSVQNGSKQATTTGSGSYSIAGLKNGSFNFSYTKVGFETGYLEVTVNGANVANANKTIFDNKPIFITINSPKNNSVNNTGFINVTVSLDRTGTALINWDGSNESMVGDGTHFYKNKTGLLSGNYSFRVYANDSNSVFSASETRIITVNRTIINNTIGNFINISTFIINTTLEIASPGGNTTLIIPNGTNASVSGSPVTSISIDSVAKINSTFAANLAGNDKFIGENVTFSPPGAVFDPPIQIRFNYTDAQIAAAGITASQLRVKFYNTTTNTWVEQTPYILNETGKYITANVSHFSAFVLLGTTTTTTHSNPPSSSGGGGGGGGGGPSGENFTNIIVKEKYDLQIYKDIVTSYKFKNTSNPILSINIVGNINAGEIGTAVEVLRNTSSLVKTPAPGNVYKNVNVWVGTSGFGTSKNIKQAVITFRIENSWISSNNMKSSGIKMVRWDGSIWDQLETSEKTKDSAYSYFEAKTNSFSSFAITGMEKKEYITENADVIEPTKPAAAIQPGEKNYDYLTNWFLIIGVFFAIGLIIEMYQRMKKK